MCFIMNLLVYNLGVDVPNLKYTDTAPPSGRYIYSKGKSLMQLVYVKTSWTSSKTAISNYAK